MPTFEQPWTETRLREFARARLGRRKLVVVSNREPYVHQLQNGDVTCIQPPGGLTLALGPVLRSCGGTWIAHGSGSADRETADEFGRLQVPPEKPAYTLRRVWLTKEEEEGYYYGFANSALWPLCHVAFVRPLFQREHWEQYVSVNRKFAQVVKEEVGSDPAIVFIQDYHFALLPRMIRREIPHALIAQFWHIPWPNPEVFRICPWGKEVLDGMLGNHLMGFHIRYQCNNFLDTIDRVLEARTDREHSAVSYRDQMTHVRPFPISVDFDGISALQVDKDVARLRKRFRLEGKRVAVGVDRMDYTKGIPERLKAVDRFLTRNPAFKEKFVFIQIAVPSRTHIDEYEKLGDHIDALVEDINWRHKTDKWDPVVLITEHVPPDGVVSYLRLADVCMVTSLHDGMNLVAKEFVACRSDQRGALILSPFTGSARELEESIQVNPFAIDEMADALARALNMPPEEQERRMSRLRARVKQDNVFRWAASVLEEAVKLHDVV